MSNGKNIQERQLSRSKQYKQKRRRKRKFIFTFFILFLLISLFVAVPIIYSSTMFDQLFQSKEEVKPTNKLEDQEQVLAVAANTPSQKVPAKTEKEIKPQEKVKGIETKAENKCTCQTEAKKKEDIRVIEQEAKKKENVRVIEHEVKKKETLFSITMLYFSSSRFQKEISAYNGITNPEKEIRAGMKIDIPNPQFMFYHKVAKGETLASISRKYYGSASYTVSLANFNKITNPDQLKLGTLMQIPSPSSLQKNALLPVQEKSDKKDTNNKAATSVYSIVIKKSTNQLVVYQDKKAIKTFSVGTGKNTSLTPEGTYKIVNKIEKPFYSTKGIAGGDPKNPLGSHWLGLNVPGTNGTKYGIHGTNDPSSIGGYVSLGCIRMKNTDVEWLFNHIPQQTVVTIK